MRVATMNKKIEILNQLVLVNIGTYYEINLTKNIVPGIMYQVIDKQLYNINEMIRLPENAHFSDIIAYWSDCLPEKDRAAYFKFFDRERLIHCYEQGEEHVFHSYWTKKCTRTANDSGTARCHV